MLEVRVNKQRDQNIERKQRGDEKLGREKNIENSRAKRTQLEILYLHHSLYIRCDKMW